MRLMWRLGAVANTLNVTPGQRLSVALVYLLGLMVLLTAWWPEGWIGTVALAAVVMTVNHDFYRFLAARRGVVYVTGRAIALALFWLLWILCGMGHPAACPKDRCLTGVDSRSKGTPNS